MTRPSALLFDLDGTLIDSSADLCASGNFLRAGLGLPDLTQAMVATYIGDGVEALVRRLLGPEHEAKLGEHVDAFKVHYREHCLDQTRLYDGVDAALRSLHAHTPRLAIVTNKPERVSRRILAGLGVASLFGSVVGGDSAPKKKPAPEPLWLACQQLGVSPADAVMIGDSHVDIQAGKAAGTLTWALKGGIGDDAAMLAAGPDRIFDNFSELLHGLRGD